MASLFVGIAGIIGAGKSTLTRELAEEISARQYYEPAEENEYLADFYRDPSKYSFEMQIYLLNARFQQHQQVVWSTRPAVQDRTIYEDTIFADMLVEAELMERRAYRTYVGLFVNMTKFLERPDVILYLDVTPEVALERVNQRRRAAESGMTLEYLQGLRVAYERWYETQHDLLNIVRVPWLEFMPAESVAELALSAADKSRSPRERWGRYL